jgi:hypothetical protein
MDLTCSRDAAEGQQGLNSSVSEAAPGVCTFATADVIVLSLFARHSHPGNKNKTCDDLQTNSWSASRKTAVAVYIYIYACARALSDVEGYQLARQHIVRRQSHRTELMCGVYKRLTESRGDFSGIPSPLWSVFTCSRLTSPSAAPAAACCCRASISAAAACCKLRKL